MRVIGGILDGVAPPMMTFYPLDQISTSKSNYEKIMHKHFEWS